MTALFEIDDVSLDLALANGPSSVLSRAGRRLNLLSGINLTIGAGETVGLVGESGSGKTTLARAMLGLVPISGGTLRFEGTRLTNVASFARIRRNTAMMFQDSIASLSPRMKIGALITEPYSIHRIAVPDRAVKTAALLSRVGLPAELANRYPHELSGGQARRVCVARALALDPRLVVADEPTAGLDVSVQGEILNLLGDLKARLGIGFLVISHNLAVVRHVTDRVAILYLGRLVETGSTRAVFGDPRHPYTQSLIAAEPQPDPRRRRADLRIKGDVPSVLNRPHGCEFHTRCPAAQDVCRVLAPAVRAFGQGRTVRCHLASTD